MPHSGLNCKVSANLVNTWESYRDVPRLGRKTRIGGKQREALWVIFQGVQSGLAQRGLLTWPMLLRQVAAHLAASDRRPFDFAIIDESQDLDVAELRFLSTFGNARANSLFFTGDLGQRIFQQPFPWRALGVDIRGRAHTLTINYRTSHQIRQQADRLLPPSLTDVDGNTEERRGTISIFNGSQPTITVYANQGDETAAVARWIAVRLAEGIRPEEIGVFVQDQTQLERATAAITLQERIERVTDESDLEEIYTTERHLLYVACTRARDHLLVTGVEPASEFLEDMR